QKQHACPSSTPQQLAHHVGSSLFERRSKLDGATLLQIGNRFHSIMDRICNLLSGHELSKSGKLRTAGKLTFPENQRWLFDDQPVRQETTRLLRTLDPATIPRSTQLFSLESLDQRGALRDPPHVQPRCAACRYSLVLHWLIANLDKGTCLTRS